MNISYQWLKALIPALKDSPEGVAEVLALRGAPVEDLLHLAPGLENLVVARVESLAPHPNADRLTVCQVNAGNGEVQVVCGAPNVQAGAYYPYVAPGSELPGGMVIKAVTLRGVDSQGMLCSEAELGLGPDDEGIMPLEGEFSPGEPLTAALGLDDWLMDVEVTPNRGDLLSHIGVARELAPDGPNSLTLPPIPGSSHHPWDAQGSSLLPLETGETVATAGGVSVRVDDPDLCSRYLGAVIRGVQVGPSPAWLASRIRAAGSRPINNVVDATNYVLLELGQPLHAFDLGKLGDSSIVVRKAKEGEHITTLDGEDRRLSEGMLAICDASVPVAIAGVMGGSDSEVSAGTTDILLECALFDPKSVRATRNALDMSTDASFRFERGVDPEGMELAVRRTVEIILAAAGGEPDSVVLDACPRPWTGLDVGLRPSRVKALLGIVLSEEGIQDLLTPLGFTLKEGQNEAQELTFAVPGFRSYDVLREVDLLEEVARSYGYDRFPSDLGPFRPGSVPDHLLYQVEDDLRDLLVGEGFLEAQTMAFAPEAQGVVEVSNPVSKEEAWLRTGLLPGLVRRMEYNFARGSRDIRLFEIGTVFLQGEGNEAQGKVPPKEETHLGLVMTGGEAPIHWTGDSKDIDLWYLKGLLSRLPVAARMGDVSVAAGAPALSGLVPEEAFTVLGPDSETRGFAGRLSPEGVDAPPWAGRLWALQLVLPSDPGPRPVPLFEPPPAFPGVDRDLALLLPKGVRVHQVEEVIREASGPLLVELGIFDLYEGKGVPKDHRSVAFRLRFQSDERTLTDKFVERSVAGVIDRLREDLGVETRS